MTVTKLGDFALYFLEFATWKNSVISLKKTNSNPGLEDHTIGRNLLFQIKLFT